MPIKVLIKRRFKDGYVKEINKVIKEIRFGAMDQEGYITVRPCGTTKIRFEL